MRQIGETWRINVEGTDCDYEFRGTFIQAFDNVRRYIKRENYPGVNDDEVLRINWFMKCDETSEIERGTIVLFPIRPGCVDGGDHEWVNVPLEAHRGRPGQAHKRCDKCNLYLKLWVDNDGYIARVEYSNGQKPPPVTNLAGRENLMPKEKSIHVSAKTT